MIVHTRRRFCGGAALGGLALSSRRAWGRAKPRIVVIGGGIGGCTVARYLAMSLPAADITIVEPKTRYTTGIFSNLYLAGLRSLESLTFGYGRLTAHYGIKLVHEIVVTIDHVTRQVRLQNGATLPYDRLVVVPGIAFVPDAIEGYGAAAAEVMPHAWQDGRQMMLLRAQLKAMDDGGVFVITVPPAPYRSPSAPYERAALAAYYLKQFKPRSKVLILDAKDSFHQQDLFQDGWTRHFPGMIEWLPARSTGGVKGIDVTTRSIVTRSGSFKASVANVIPPQTAGDVARLSGLVDASGWCPVDPCTFESKRQQLIHVIGDAAGAGEMPKSAFAANSQAKACAFAIAAALQGVEPPPPHLLEASYSFLAGNDVVGTATRFTAAHRSIKAAQTATSELGERKERRRYAVQEAHGWFDAFVTDVFD